MSFLYCYRKCGKFQFFTYFTVEKKSINFKSHKLIAEKNLTNLTLMRNLIMTSNCFFNGKMMINGN